MENDWTGFRVGCLLLCVERWASRVGTWRCTTSSGRVIRCTARDFFSGRDRSTLLASILAGFSHATVSDPRRSTEYVYQHECWCRCSLQEARGREKGEKTTQSEKRKWSTWRVWSRERVWEFVWWWRARIPPDWSLPFLGPLPPCEVPPGGGRRRRWLVS